MPGSPQTNSIWSGIHEHNSRAAYGQKWPDRSLCDTNMKLGINDLHKILIIKSACSQFENSRWPPKSKMAAMKYGQITLLLKLLAFLDNMNNKSF